VKFKWTPKCEESFLQLIFFFTSAPILKIENLDENFVVCTDSSKEGLDGGLNQKDRVACIESRKLKEYERNYDTHDLEL